ncbi:MAG: hypothetical protein GQ574_23645 [Crocinitomix sp.]|nr:hypothetical protein [Crocinitomix sp.]
MKTNLFILFMLAFGTAKSQTVRIDLGYSHLYSLQLDRAIQTYNFSRPNLTEKQPFIQHGFISAVTVYFKRNENLKSGFSAKHTYFSSSVSNPNAAIKFNYHMFDLGYALNYRKPSSKLFGEVGVYAVVGSLTKQLNGEPFTSDGSPVHSWQFGGLINLNLGYLMTISERLKLAPFISANFSPYLSKGESESVINQTSGLVYESYTTFFRFEAGLSIHYDRVAK